MDVVRTRNAVEDTEQLRLEALRPQRDAVDAVAAKQLRQRRRHRLGVGLDRDLCCRRQGREQALQLARLGEGRRPAAEKDGLELRREQLALELELGQQSVHVAGVLAAAPDDGDEIAVAAPVRAERQVDVQVPDQGIACEAAKRPWRLCRRGRQSRPRAVERPKLFAAERCRPHFLLPSLRLSTARKASWGTSTAPTCFIRRLPAFCFSSSLRLRLMSPP